MEKKVRIQLFDSEGRLTSDRMVSQDTEFNAGPKFTHKDTIRIEFTLMDKDDVADAKDYLDQLVGDLPLPVPKGRKPLNKEVMPDESREELLQDAIEQAEDQDGLIKYLREHDFVFLTTDFLDTFGFDTGIKEKHRDEYQWMLRCIRRAKNPKADKYDPELIFGIKLYGDRTEKVVVYLKGEFKKTHRIELPSKPKETFKKSGMMKFPEYFTEQERDKFRYELRQYQNNPEKPLSKFFKRWLKYVENVPELENPRE